MNRLPVLQPVNLIKILHGDDPTLITDTTAVFNRLTDILGYAGVGWWMSSEHPYLERDDLCPVRRWWVLQTKLDTLTGLAEGAG